MDLAVGHVKALKKIEEKAGVCIYNLGTGKGYSVLDVVKAYEKPAAGRLNTKLSPEDQAISQPATRMLLKPERN